MLFKSEKENILRKANRLYYFFSHCFLLELKHLYNLHIRWGQIHTSAYTYASSDHPKYFCPLYIPMWQSHRVNCYHDDVNKWKHFPRNRPFVRGIHQPPVNSQHKGQWRGALMFTLICVWINGCVNNREAGDLRHYCAHYGVTVMMGVYVH